MDTILIRWPYAGLGLAVLLLGWLLLEKRRLDAPPRWRDPAWVLPLLWPMYLLHQFEEHGVDLRGQHYAFLEGLCTTLGYRSAPKCPADPAFIFAVNGVACQIAFALSWIFRRKNPLVAACAWGIPMVNAVVHIGSGITRGEYNPGVLTSVILFVPLCALMLRTVLRAGVIERRHVPLIIASGVLVHAVLLVSLFLRARGLISHGALLLVNSVDGFIPLAFFSTGSKRAFPAR